MRSLIWLAIFVVARNVDISILGWLCLTACYVVDMAWWIFIEDMQG